MKRDTAATYDRLYSDYFTKDSIYDEHHFHRRFRMWRHLFLHIMEALDNHSKYFQVRYDATEKRGLMPLTKCTTTVRMLAYGIAANCIHEYLKFDASTVLECMKKFTLGVIEVFREEYLRKPNQAQLQVAESHCKLLKSVIFWVCWEASITCIGSEKIVQRVGRHHFKLNFIRCQLSFMKLLHHTTLGMTCIFRFTWKSQ